MANWTPTVHQANRAIFINKFNQTCYNYISMQEYRYIHCPVFRYRRREDLQTQRSYPLARDLMNLYQLLLPNFCRQQAEPSSTIPGLTGRSLRHRVSNLQSDSALALADHLCNPARCLTSTIRASILMHDANVNNGPPFSDKSFRLIRSLILYKLCSQISNDLQAKVQESLITEILGETFY